MSFSSEPSSRPASTLPRQDTATTMSSFSTSCSNLDNSESISSASTLRKPKNTGRKKRKKSIDHFAGFGDEKTMKTLKVHYYPEGNWGWFVIVIAVCVQTFNHGLHTAYGVFLAKLMDEFGSNINAGDYKLIDSALTTSLRQTPIVFVKKLL